MFKLMSNVLNCFMSFNTTLLITKSFPYSKCLRVIQRQSSPFGVVVFFGMPNSESESEFTVSTTFFCLGALLALGAVSEGGLPIKQTSFKLATVIYLPTNQAEVSSVTVDSFLFIYFF